MTKDTSLRVIRDTVADYCRDKLDRPSAIATLKLAGMNPKGAAIILDAADRNLVLKANYRAAFGKVEP
jgi:hypothetical protein